MPYYIFKCYLLLKLASHLVRTRTTMEISSTPIAFCVIFGIVIMCSTIINVFLVFSEISSEYCYLRLIL